MESTSHFPIDEIRRHLEILTTQWNDFVMKKKSGAGGITARTRQLLDTEDDYDQLSVSISHSVIRLREDWRFIDMLVKCIFKSSAAAAKESLLPKSKGVADAISSEVSSCIFTNQSGEYYFINPQKILDLLDNCQRKTDELCNLEIRGALVDLDSSEFGIESRIENVREYFEFFNLFALVLADNLRLIKDTGGGVVSGGLGLVSDELLWIHWYLNAVVEDVASSDFGNNAAVDAVLTGAELLVLRIAFQSCKLWFNRSDPEAARVATAAILDLQREIQPSNLVFLHLALECQEYLHGINMQTASVGHFCTYILLDTPKDDLVSKEMNSLVTLYFDSPIEDGGEDVRSLFTEILAVIGEAAYHARKLEPEASLRAFSLPKICLLKAEFFLKVQLLAYSHTPSMLLGDSLLFKVTMILTTLRSMSEDQRIMTLCEQGNTFVKGSLELAVELRKEIDFLQRSLHSKKMSSTMVKHSLLQLLFRIAFFKSDSFLIDLLKNTDVNGFLTHCEKDQFVAIVEDLKYFKRIVMNKMARDTPTEETIIRQVEATVRDTALLSYSFFRSSLPRVLDNAKLIKAKLNEISQQFPKSILPKFNSLGFIGRSISELLTHDPLSIAPVRHHIQEVLTHLESLESFVIKVKDLDVEQGELNDLRNQVIEVAYKLEYVVQTIEADGHLEQSMWLYELLEDIRLLDQRVSEIHEVSFARKVNNSPMLSPNTAAEINEMLVGLGDEEEAVVQRLTRGSAQRDIVSIVGMPGIGKTTLARKVYNTKTVTYYFHRRAWCTVSQAYSKRDLLLELLSHMPFLTDVIIQLSEDDLLAKLRQCLLGNKYLIVMDDVWDTAAWNDFRLCFPDDSNGSRILITSRLQDVASKIKPGSDPYSISLLSDAQSWMLLQKKVFGGAVCPKELMETGLAIAQICQGLPLAVVTIAGLLQRIENSEESWKAVTKSFSSEIIDNPENMCRRILEVSYNHLPEHLKACFLYFGVFLENKDIPAKKLMRYWMAEGLVQETESKSLEEVAEEYLLELVNRSLVNIFKRRSNGKVRTCNLHDLLRDLCHLKAKEENFLQAVTINDEPYSSYLDSDYELEFDSMNDPVTFESYRLSFCLKRQHFIDSRPLGLGVRSLTFFASVDMEPKCPYDISFICHNFKLPRLLDLEYIMASQFPAEIGLMIQLRYLAVSGYMQSIPASIADLWRLETLVVNGLRGKVLLPETIWKMVGLRHLHVNNHVAFSMNGLDEQLGSSCLLPNLISFSTPSLYCGDDTLSILSRLPNLRKLRCNFIHSRHSSEDCNGFHGLEFLTCLESLKLIYRGRARNSREFIRLPSNLKKLTLSNFCLLGNHLSIIEELSNLTVLKLQFASFEEPTWVMKEDKFKELTFLELDCMNLVEWDASYEHLPCLEQLVLRNCKDLKAIPYDFAYINTLKTIEVQWCGKSVVASAEEIREATEEIEVLITRL